MPKIYQITVPNGQDEFSFRVQKSVQHLDVTRTGVLAIFAVGLAFGLPERYSVEIARQGRHSINPAREVQVAHAAVWAAADSGLIVETAQSAGVLVSTLGTGIASLEANAQVSTRFKLYLNDNGPIELDANDQCTVTIKNAVAGATYTIEVPDASIIPAAAQQYLLAERNMILQDTISKPLFTAGIQGIILPNNPDAIESLVIDWIMSHDAQTGETTVDRQEYSLDEVMRIISDKYAAYSRADFVGGALANRRTLFHRSQDCDFLLLDYSVIAKLEIKSVLGETVEYTTFRIADRNEA